MSPKRKSAFSAVLREAQQDREAATQQSRSTEIPLEGEAVTPLHSETAERQHRGMVKKEEKVSFYLTHEQASKLDDLAHAYRKQAGKRINRNTIVRHLIDRCDLADLDGIES